MSKRTKKGHLNKQHGGLGKKNTWNLYFFEMIGGVYFHYYKGNSKKPAHQIMVNEIVKVCASDKGTSNTFEVHFRGNGSPWVLDAGSEEEMISWMEVLYPESSKPVVEMIQHRRKLKELSRAKEVQSLSSTWSPGQFQSASIKQQFGNHGNRMDPRIDQMQHSNHPSQSKQPPPIQPRNSDHYNPVDPRYVHISHSYSAGQMTGVPQHPRLNSPRLGECLTEDPLLQHCPVQGPQHHHWQPHSPPHHLSAPTKEPDTFVPTTRMDGVPVPKPRTKLKSYPAASLQPSRSVTQPEMEPSANQIDIKHRRANTDIRRSVSPQPYEVFRQSKPDQEGISDSSGYVIMKGGDNGTTTPEPVNTGGNQIDGPGDNMARPMAPEDVFRYFDSSQLSHLAKLFRQMSAAQGKEAPLTESGQLDKDAVVQAITGISDELLEDSGQLDSIGECTEEEEDFTSLDEMSRQAFTIQNEWLSEFNPIGKGAFGEVFHALLRYAPSANPIEVAVKTVKPSASKADRENFQKEVQIMATLLHPNVVKMFGVIEDPESCTVRVVLEFLHKGDLRTYLQKSETKPSVKRLVKFMFDVASGMHYIASKGLVHRDLAARNVLVSNDEVCKVADFGLLRHVEGEQELYRAQSSLRLPARWMAPECLSDLCFSLASDVWSFGILMWEMFHPEEKYPYPSLSNQAVMLKVPQGYTMDIPEEAPPTVHNIMKQCWHLFPKNRPSFLLISTLLCKCHLQLV